MQTDEDHVLQFVEQTIDECSVVQQLSQQGHTEHHKTDFELALR